MFITSVLQYVCVCVLTCMCNGRVDLLTWTEHRCFQKCKTRWRESGQSWGGRARQHPAGHRHTPILLAFYLNYSWYWKSCRSQHSSEQEEPVEPHQLCASLPCGGQRNRLAMTANVPNLTKIVQPTPTTKQPINPFTRVPHPNVVASLTVCTNTVLWL